VGPLLKIDYRRRLDQVTAVIQVVTSVWLRIDQIAERQKELRNSKWRKVEYVLLVGGALLNWWLAPPDKFELNFGGWMMLLAALMLAGFVIEDFNLGRDLTAQQRVQSDFLFRWLASK